MTSGIFPTTQEPSLDQILAEPIVRQMMKRDGNDEAGLCALLAKLAKAREAPQKKIEVLSLQPPLPPPHEMERSEVCAPSPRASIGVLAQAGTPPAWPRVFPGL